MRAILNRNPSKGGKEATMRPTEILPVPEPEPGDEPEPERHPEHPYGPAIAERPSGEGRWIGWGRI